MARGSSRTTPVADHRGVEPDHLGHGRPMPAPQPEGQPSPDLAPQGMALVEARAIEEPAARHPDADVCAPGCSDIVFGGHDPVGERDERSDRHVEG